jgi:hypothetical protein
MTAVIFILAAFAVLTVHIVGEWLADLDNHFGDHEQ